MFKIRFRICCITRCVSRFNLLPIYSAWFLNLITLHLLSTLCKKTLLRLQLKLPVFWSAKLNTSNHAFLANNSFKTFWKVKLISGKQQIIWTILLRSLGKCLMTWKGFRHSEIGQPAVYNWSVMLHSLDPYRFNSSPTYNL